MGEQQEVWYLGLAGEHEGLFAHLSSSRDLPPDEMKEAQAIQGREHLRRVAHLVA
jgi:hypothetical protein